MSFAESLLRPLDPYFHYITDNIARVRRRKPAKGGRAFWVATGADVNAVDRWGRSVTDLLATLQALEHRGVSFVSLTEASDLTTAAGRAMAVFADFQRGILRERVRAGVAHARPNGRRLGRPLTAALYTDQGRRLQRAGLRKS